MPHLAYGWPHQQVRARLLAELRAAGVAACAICGGPISPEMALHVHHSNPAAKLAGLPGDCLAHAKCNLGYGNGTRQRKGRRGAARQSRRW